MDTLFSKRTMNRFVNRAVDASGYTMGVLATAVIIIPVVELLLNQYVGVQNVFSVLEKVM